MEMSSLLRHLSIIGMTATKSEKESSYIVHTHCRLRAKQLAINNVRKIRVAKVQHYHFLQAIKRPFEIQLSRALRISKNKKLKRRTYL